MSVISIIEIRLGCQALKTSSLALPVVGIQIIFSNYFQYVNRPKVATFMGLSRQCLFLIPSLFVLPRFFELEGVFYAQPVSDLLSATIAVLWTGLALRSLEKPSK